jgi:hypothetical protein
MKTVVYLHSSKESMRDHGQSIGLTEDQLKNFIYACYEVAVELDVDASGNAKVVGAKDA